MRPRDNWRNAKPHKAASFWPPRLADHPKIGEIITEVRSLGDRAATAHAEAEQLRTQVDQAGQNDKAAFALAVREGKERPKPTQPAAEKRLEEKLAEVDALDRAMGQATTDGFAAVTEHGPAIVAELRDKELAKLKAKLLKAIDEVSAQAIEVEQTIRLISWLSQEEARSWDSGVKLGRLPKPDMPRTDVPPEFEVWVAAIHSAAESIGAPRKRPDGFPSLPNHQPVKQIQAAH